MGEREKEGEREFDQACKYQVQHLQEKLLPEYYWNESMNTDEKANRNEANLYERSTQSRLDGTQGGYWVHSHSTGLHLREQQMSDLPCPQLSFNNVPILHLDLLPSISYYLPTFFIYAHNFMILEGWKSFQNHLPYALFVWKEEQKRKMKLKMLLNEKVENETKGRKVHVKN